MTPEEQRQLVLDALARRERIAAETRTAIADLSAGESLDPLAAIDPAIREQAEDAFYGALGRHRYRAHDGRTLFLTPEEIANRHRARSRKSRAASSSYDMLSGDERRRTWLGWAFNIGAILLALVIVGLILR